MRFIITAAPGDTTVENKSAIGPDGSFDPELFAAYMRFNEEMHQAGVLVASEGLNPAGKGARIGVSRGKRAVLDGPFAESKELVGGFYVLEVESLDEAITWALRCPVGLGTDNVLEIRPLTEMTDIPPDLLALSRKVAPAWTASATEPRPRQR
ncbi:MAG TPA: YciI family protein [Polyangia bacterium]|jgi:hypothetical protein